MNPLDMFALIAIHGEFEPEGIELMQNGPHVGLYRVGVTITKEEAQRLVNFLSTALKNNESIS